MGLLNGFFIATGAEVNVLDISQSPAGSLPAVQARSVEVVKLTSLQCITNGSVFSDHLEQLGAMRERIATRVAFNMISGD